MSESNEGNSNRGGSTSRVSSIDELVAQLSQNTELISMVREKIAALSPANEGVEEDVEAVAQAVIRQVVNDQNQNNLNQNQQVSSMNYNTSNSVGCSQRQNGTYRKAVSFSSVSVPGDYDDSDNAYADNTTNFSSGRPVSPPPILTNSPPTRTNPISTVQFNTNNYDTEDALSALSGEPTASGDSSIASLSNHGTRRSAGESATGSLSSGNRQVMFSAINPNPHLILRTENNIGESEDVSHHVSFTMDVNEVPQISSRGSRSGISSPSIEPPASPPRPKLRSDVSINDSTIEVITEAADRLRSQVNDERSTGSSSRGHRVHFSAMKEFVRDVSRSETFEEDDDQLNLDEIQNDQNHVHFAQNVDVAAHSYEETNPLCSYTEEEMSVVADRLRRVIRRAEEIGNLTLEDAFAQFDIDHSGRISAEELQSSLRRLGSTFEFTLAECSALIGCFTGHHSEEMSLLAFYRAMGRRSPPPTSVVPSTPIAHMDLSESPAVHADNAANRLRSHILTLEQGANISGIEATFRQLDMDMSGYITADEFHEGLRTLGTNDNNFPPMNDDDCEELVQIFDANKDGKVSLVDFYRFMGRRSPPLVESSNIDNQHVKKAAAGTKDEKDKSSINESDTCRILTSRKKKDDDDDDDGIGGRSCGVHFSPSIMCRRESTNADAKEDSSQRAKESNSESSEEAKSSLLFKSKDSSPGSIEVVMKRPQPSTGLFLSLLNERNSEDSHCPKVCHNCDFDNKYMLSRDDSEILGKKYNADDRMDVMCLDDIPRKLKRGVISLFLERAINNIEIDNEGRSHSPQLNSSNMVSGSVVDSVRRGAGFGQVHDSSQFTLDISENLTERNETNFAGVELSYDETYQTISIVDHGLVDKVLA